MLYIPIPEYSSTVDSKKFHTQIFHNTDTFFIEGAGKKSSFLNISSCMDLIRNPLGVGMYNYIVTLTLIKEKG